jgi:glycerophosphoryl diester phosphodiesterase
VTLIIAHRGASAEAPENTMAAFTLAHRQGADMIELDLLPTADGRLAVFHDETTERWDGRPRPVAACSLAELQQLDIGGERVPVLEEVLAFAAETGMALNLELKAAGMGARCAALLREFGVAEQVIVSSFYPAALHELRAVAPELRRAYLMGTRSYRPDVRAREFWPFFELRAVAASAWHPSDELPGLAQSLPLVRRAGYQVNVWTVDDPARMRALAALGASGIITNCPAVGLHALGRS